MPICPYCRDSVPDLDHHLRNAFNHPSPTRSFQTRAFEWLYAAFGIERALDQRERCLRFLEEAAELVQSLDLTQGEAMEIVKYVYGRPKGKPIQEAGGVMTTFHVLCQVAHIDAQATGELALERNWHDIESIREKNKTKLR